MIEFTRIPTVLSAEELVDKAFRRASRISSSSMGTGKPVEERIRMAEMARVRTVQNLLSQDLQRYVRKFPSFDQLHPFYADLVAILIDMDRTRKALGAVDWAAKRVNQIGDETASALKLVRNNNEAVLDARKKMYGRVNSVVAQVDKDLAHLNAVRDELKRLPSINPDVPTLVVAGYPNVGKSSLIRKVSTAEPEVAAYPFTTKGVVIGHFRHGRSNTVYQIIDTPGLLDRAFDERNAIELQAITALKHLADVIVFILDPSEFCGYSLDAQEKLLASTQASFPETPVVVVENKADIRVTDASGRHRISTVTGEGIDDLVAASVHAIIEKDRQKVLATAMAAPAPKAGMPNAPMGVRRVPSRAERDAAAARRPVTDGDEDEEAPPAPAPKRRPSDDEEEG